MCKPKLETPCLFPLLLCADIGTSSLKTALIDTSGSLHAHARIPYGDEQGVKPNCLEAPNSWRKAFFSALEQLASQAPGQKADALIISGNGPTLVPVTKDGKSLRPLHWYDPAAPLEGIVSFFLPKVKAFMENYPGLFAETRIFLSPQEWLSWKLGAGMVTVLPHGGYENYYWNDEQCIALGIGRDRFPPFVMIGAQIGKLGAYPEIDSSLLLPGTPIIAGASDFIMALIGTGVLNPGMVCDRTGSSEGINLCVSSDELTQRLMQKPRSAEGLRVLPHAAPGLWNLGALIRESGKLLADYRTATAAGKPYHELIADFLGSKTEDAYRAGGRKVLESMGRAFLKAIQDLQAPGFTVGEMILSGGQSRDPLWNQYKANISGRILKIPEITDAELAGNAVLGAAALEGGDINGDLIKKKAAAMIRITKSYYPEGNLRPSGSAEYPEGNLRPSGSADKLHGL
jgi:xylulokinase